MFGFKKKCQHTSTSKKIGVYRTYDGADRYNTGITFDIEISVYQKCDKCGEMVRLEYWRVSELDRSTFRSQVEDLVNMGYVHYRQFILM